MVLPGAPLIVTKEWRQKKSVFLDKGIIVFILDIANEMYLYQKKVEQWLM